ncbi:MAG: hypothetical protein UT24_C0016G0025 [Candidatus Woesebacteria bacterium GW2011_GWB1_39_12]|uniref:Uncharacterized protein n=1 Tax=Candidatus Woesebacteria bacterium GW2011_GWB1_39_12 TaxID=1618574 RepID=A0A0G0MIG9_9BACT|nr:MAG: hypothetical protein UT24_C0016G0025 [Candidatus Woesebacteria bacterium GW2011_GWB1_39_12]
MNTKKCKHSITTMSKVGFDFRCDKCGGIVLDMSEDNFTDNEYMEEVKRENDEEARMEELDRMDYNFDRNFENGTFDEGVSK